MGGKYKLSGFKLQEKVLILNFKAIISL